MIEGDLFSVDRILAFIAQFIIVEKWYSPNDYKDVLEKRVLFSNGIIYENHKKIREYK